MYCENCGTKIEKDAQFCQNCGTTLGEIKQAKPIDEESVKKHKSNSNVGVGVGLLVSAIGGSMESDFGGVLAILGYGMFIWGCVEYAEYKGYGWKTGLLGILSILGLIILVCLPNKNKVAKVK